MGAGVKLTFLFLTILYSSTDAHVNLSTAEEEFILYNPDVDRDSQVHSIKKRQLTPRVDWNDEQPYLDGPNKDEIQINKNIIFMNEEMEPEVTIAELNYKGPGDISLLRFISPSSGNATIGLISKKVDGKIFLITTLKQDYEAGHLRYVVEVTVTEEGNQPKTNRLVIEIINIDDNPPVVLAPPCDVEELYIGITNCVFTISDRDGFISTSVMELRFIGSDIVNQSFILDSRKNHSEYEFSVTLHVVKELEFFLSQIHIFDLVAYDSLPNNGSAQVIVRVIDVPNMPPMWQSIFATQTFDELEEKHFTVKAIDGDTGINKPICYRIEKDFDIPVIEIGEENGEILVEPIDRDELQKEVFTFDIVAYKCDNKTWTAPSTTVFVVNDINNKIPEIVTKNFEISILEESYVPLVFPEVITVHDRDLALNARYSVELESISPESAADAFLIIPKDGYQRQEFQMSIVNASMLDYDTEGWETIYVKVVATEELNKTHIGTATVTINLQNWNDEKPIFLKEEYSVELNETVEAGKYVDTVYAEDRDIGDNVIHSIRGRMAEYLNIDQGTGDITMKVDNVFDYDRQQEVIVQVEARDTLNSSSMSVNVVITQLTINVLDVNNKPPQITMPTEPASVTEHVPEGTVFNENIFGSDVDTDASLEFSINWDASYAIKQGRLVDKNIYTGCVDIKTEFIDQSSKGNAKGKLVAKQIGPNALDTIDFEDIEVLHLSVILTDHNTVVGANYTQAFIVINIVDINDNKPVWNPETDKIEFMVREEADTGTVIGSVQATDRDGPIYNVISYFIEPRNGTGKDLVEINSNRGQMTVKQGKDISADFPPTYFLYYTLIASDCTAEIEPGCYNETIDVKISVIDINNQTPFEELEKDDKVKRIKEHSPEGSLIMTIPGVDLDRDDPYNNVSYSIMTNQVRHIFDIDVHTGEIKTKHPDDLERDYGTTEHEIMIQLIDNYYFDKDRSQRVNSTIIKVILIDINDNAPEFEPLNQDWTVNENTEQNVIIAKIRAHDRDEENTPNSQVNYKLLGVSKLNLDGSYTDIGTDLFEMKTVNVDDGDKYKFAGNLITKKSLRSHWGEYKIEIQAHDMSKDEEIRFNNVIQKLSIEPFNFNRPLITYPGNSQVIRLSLEEAMLGRLRYAANGTMLHSVIAIDEDGGDAGRVSFSIEGDDLAKQFFEVDTLLNNEGQFKLKEQISEYSEYSVTLVATDHGQTPLSSNITFIFEVMSTNTMPEFVLDHYTTNFTEFETGQLEAQHLPEAVDVVGGRPLYYYLAGEYQEIFTVGKTKPIMKLQEGKQLNRTEKNEYSIRYRVAIVDPDIEGNPKYSEMTVTVEVREANPKPVFELSQYVGGISIIDDVKKKITTVKATHTENLGITYAIDNSSMVVDDSSLENIKDIAFSVDPIIGDIFLDFKPVATMKGKFQFNVTATDTNNVTSSTSVVVFIVSDINRITFTFLNPLEEVENKRATIATIFTEEFEYQCSIDSIVQSTDDSGIPIDNVTDVRTHFMENDIAISADILAEKRGDYVFVANIIRRFGEHSLKLGDFLSGSTIPESMEKMLQMILIVVSTVLGTLCILLVVVFCIRTKRLNRRLEALSTTKFGSQESGLNRVGITVPGTNKHALEGSNPVWNEDIKAPNFDELSNFSGDSDLIGIEDNPQFAYDNQGLEKPEQNFQNDVAARRNTGYNFEKY